MSKAKNKKSKQIDRVEAQVDTKELDPMFVGQCEEVATVLTYLVSYVNPTINKEAAYEALFGALLVGLTMENVRDIGITIRKTSAKYGSNSDTKH
jgi:hypothetical protein